MRGGPSPADTRDKPHRCRQARTLFCCRHQQVPQAPNAGQRCDRCSCSAQLRLLSSEGHSVTIGHQPCKPIGSDRAHQPLQKSLFAGFAIGGSCRCMSQRTYDVSACPLAVRKRDCTHVEARLLAQVSLRGLTFQHHDPMVVAGYRAHGRGIRVLISIVLLLEDIVHFADALATAFAFGLSLTSPPLPCGWCFPSNPLPSPPSHLGVRHLGSSMEQGIICRSNAPKSLSVLVRCFPVFFANVDEQDVF